ncbi:MAG: phosphate uptake regulator PhoU [Thaumarchaeota archaeon]|nr:phosphate uptake regulator PhoU [Nitrososphaerota archaeon]
MEMRRIQEMGGGTSLVSLPKKWVTHNGLKKGSIVTMEVLPNDYLILYPYRQETTEVKQIEIPYPAKYIKLLINKVTGAYLTGYGIIKIQGTTRISFEDRNQIKKAVRNLVGLEIIEEDASSMTTQFLLEPTTLTPEKIFRRMHLIARGMVRDSIDALAEKDKAQVKAVAERDEEIDRLYFLMVRLLRSAAQDLQLSSKYGLTPVDCLDYRVAANVLESIGDSAVSIANSVDKLPASSLSKKMGEMLKQVAVSLEEMQETAVKAFLTKNADEGRLVVNRYSEVSAIVEDLTKQVLDLPSTFGASILSIASAMEKISQCNIDIADLATTMYPMIS